jgi:aconitate hydratase
LFHEPGQAEAQYSSLLDLDLATVEPSLAGPKRPQDRVPLANAQRAWRSSLLDLLKDGHGVDDPKLLGRWTGEGGKPGDPITDEIANHQLGNLGKKLPCEVDGKKFEIGQGSVVIAAITSCTNTSNPSVMVAAGLLAKKAVEKGLTRKPWVKTSLAPGSKVVTSYLRAAGLDKALDALGFNLVGYGCTTCIGNSGPLPDSIGEAVKKGDLVAVSVLSGNRNFEGRVNPLVRANYLASPPLVVAYALAGTMDVDIQRASLGNGKDGKPVYLKDIWPSPEEVETTLRKSLAPDMFRKEYGDVFTGDDLWRAIQVPEGVRYKWDEKSTYIRRAPYFDGMPKQPAPLTDIKAGRALAVFGDSITTDHISPAGNIAASGPAGLYLQALGVKPADFNSYGARRGNHNVMVRGTFANIRIKNLMAPGTEGGVTLFQPSGEKLSIYDAAVKYGEANIPLVILAGKEYGSGSSRDWAAKGPKLLGVRAVVAESFERIHRSNLVGMGVLPLQFADGDSVAKLGLTGKETFEIEGIAEGLTAGKRLTVKADGKSFPVQARIDTPDELEYFKHGGILPYVLRQLLDAKPA